MCCSEIKKLGLDNGTKKIEIFFEHCSWRVCLGFRNGNLTFDKGWFEFVKAAKICEGDVCVLQRTAAVDKFKIAVFSQILLRQWSSICGILALHFLYFI